jgi:hypothetical protein
MQQLTRRQSKSSTAGIAGGFASKARVSTQQLQNIAAKQVKMSP